MNMSKESKERIIETLMWVLLAMVILGIMYRNVVFYPSAEADKIVQYNQKLEKDIQVQNDYYQKIISAHGRKIDEFQTDMKSRFLEYFKEKRTSLYYIKEIEGILRGHDMVLSSVLNQSEKLKLDGCELFSLQYSFKYSGSYIELKKLIRSFYDQFNPLILLDLSVKKALEGKVNASFTIRIFYFLDGGASESEK